MAIPKHELAYLAGFFDGEGCVIIQKRKNVKTKHGAIHFLHVEIAQVDIKPLLKFSKYFKGRMHYDTGLRIHKFIITNTNARVFLEKILPFVITKKLECVAALKFNKLIKTSHTGRGHAISDFVYARREYYYRKLQQIKKDKYGRQNRDSR